MPIRKEMRVRRLTVFNSVTLDGYFTDRNGDMSWAKGDPNDAEWNEFVTNLVPGARKLKAGNVLLCYEPQA